jgi:hypothetical protein
MSLMEFLKCLVEFACRAAKSGVDAKPGIVRGWEHRSCQCEIALKHHNLLYNPDTFLNVHLFGRIKVLLWR